MVINRTYRPDIDGLRAFAVILVLLFHLDHEWMPGGYIGVDVFFVISGFLITRNILFDVDTGRFTFRRFYVKRMRRLFPALFVTLGLTLAVGSWLFSPADLQRLGTSTLAALFSLSNFFFWNESGYFNPSSYTKPLLHTWSLGVEEQFYLLWPAIVLGLSLVRWPLLIAVVLSALFLLSLGLNYLFLENDPEAVFFLLPFRVFEFVIGASCVWLLADRKLLNAARELLVLAGLAMMSWAALTFDRTTPFPGLHALVPCVGAMFVILGGEGTRTGWLLRNRLMVGLGLISYSIYLVHWPLIVEYRYWKFVEIDDMDRLGLLLATLVGAFLMWKYVEQPFRSSTLRQLGTPARRLVFIPASMILVLLAATVAWQSGGLPWRYPEEIYMSAEQIAAERSRYWKRATDSREALLKGDGRSGQIIVMGNSHAIDLIYALRDRGVRAEIKFLDTSHRCFNFGSPRTDADRDLCRYMLDRALKADWTRAKAVYLHDSWSRFDGKDLEQRLNRIRELTAAPIYVVGPQMTFRKSVLDIARSNMRLDMLNEYSMKFAFRENRKRINDAVRSLLDTDRMREKNIWFVDVLAAQCGDAVEACKVFSEDGEFLYFDSEHLSMAGARYVGGLLEKHYPEMFP